MTAVAPTHHVPGGPAVAIASAISAAQVVAAAPFLPAGKGALILILGGLVMLLIALVFGRWARAPAALEPRRRHAAASTLQRATPRTLPAASTTATAPLQGMPARAPWAAGLERTVEVMHLGHPHVESADAVRCVLVLERCGSCLRGSKGTRGCEPERLAILRAIQPQAARAYVAEVACNPRGDGACTFEVRRNGYF